jgi:hypothetical protein
MSYVYRLAGFKFVSDIELCELLPWDGRPEAPVEVVLRIGKVPPQLEAPDYVGSFWQTKGRDRYLAAWPYEARILIENGSEVTVEPVDGTDAADMRSLLMGPIQAVLWHQRGLLPLHASVIGINGKAVALAGPGGAGKSTLAVALARKGHHVMADDICIVDMASGADVLPGTARLRLWRDALENFGIAVGGLPRALSRSEKYLVDCGKGGESETRKLAAIVLLSRRVCDAVTIERLRGARSIIELEGVIHMPLEARALGVEPAIFAAVTKLGMAGVTVWQLVTPNDRDCLDEAAAQVLAAVLDG